MLCVHMRLNAKPGFVFVCPGIDYQYHENWNNLLMVEHHSGEGEMSDKEHKQNCWSAEKFRPEAGGCEFEPQTVRTKYV